MTAPTPVPTVRWEEHQRALDKEYRQYVAVAPIYYDGALAHNIGDPVPATNVERYGYEADGLVKKSGTKAAAAAIDPEKK